MARQTTTPGWRLITAAVARERALTGRSNRDRDRSGPVGRHRIVRRGVAGAGGNGLDRRAGSRRERHAVTALGGRWNNRRHAECKYDTLCWWTETLNGVGNGTILVTVPANATGFQRNELVDILTLEYQINEGESVEGLNDFSIGINESN
jgi:hypothetical protein